MTENNSHKGLSFIDLHSRNKYWFIVLPILCLFAAFCYVILTPARYKVSSKIVLTDPGLSTGDIGSKALVQQTLGQLPFQVNYYHRGFLKKTELSGDSLPIKFTLERLASIDTTMEVTAKILDDQLYQIRQHDTIIDFFFNKPVSEYSFAKFKGIKGPAFNKDAEPVIVRFNDPDELLEEYYNNFSVKIMDDDRTAVLSIVASSPEKGVDFLNKLIALSDRAGEIAPRYANINAKPDSSLNKIRSAIVALRAKAGQLKTRESLLEHRAAVTAERPADKQPAKLQLQVLDAIWPYAGKPVSQFVQIPDSYHVENNELAKLIGQFNKTELDKQRDLQDSQANHAKIMAFNKQIVFLKASILQEINVYKNKINVRPALPANEAVSINHRLVRDSIYAINAQLHAKQIAYESLLKTVRSNHLQTAAKSRLTIIEKPGGNIIEYPRTGLIYLLALLTGLMVPLSFPYLKNLSFSALPMISLKKLGERINELIHTKEID